MGSTVVPSLVACQLDEPRSKMTSAHSVTAVIPTFNRAAFLGRAIESVLGQTLPPSQVVVVDDGSTDDTAAVCSRYLGIEYVRQGNAGASAARNHGARRAQHRWMAFLDSDDYWTPSHLERIVTAIAATGGAAALYFDDLEVCRPGGGSLWNSVGFRPCSPHHLTHDGSAWVLMKTQPIMLQCSVIDRHVFDRLGGFDPRLRVCEDSDLFFRLGIGGTACAVTGIGAVQTSDDQTSVRLTTEIPIGSEKSLPYQRLLWSGVYRNKALPPEFQRLVRYHVAGTYWLRARSLVRSRKYPGAFGNLARVMVIDPHFALWGLRRQLSAYELTLRPACAEAVPGEEPAALGAP
jgi:glycosyltransferase involved in cell wall biosynthesis